MSLRATSLQKDTATGISRDIGSQYDNVKLVADFINYVGSIADFAALVNTYNSRITEMEHRVFQQGTEPDVGVDEGDIWLDPTDNVIKIYREYPANSGSYRWTPLLYTNNDTLDAGYW